MAPAGTKNKVGGATQALGGLASSSLGASIEDIGSGGHLNRTIGGTAGLNGINN